MRKTLKFLVILLLATLNLSVESVSLLDRGGVRPNSLLQNPQSYYEAFQARKVGDVVTVRVVENVEALKRSQVSTPNKTHFPEGGKLKEHDKEFPGTKMILKSLTNCVVYTRGH